MAKVALEKEHSLVAMSDQKTKYQKPAMVEPLAISIKKSG